MSAVVCSAAQAAARDAACIAAGTPSLDLMHRAGSGAARVLLQESATRQGPVLVFCGPGNNGGDGWVVAAGLAGAGVRVHVREVAPARTPDAVTAREAALPLVSRDLPADRPALVVDALLGTGAQGALRPPIAAGAWEMAALRARGVRVVALDLPTGLDATTGVAANGTVPADRTIAFGTVKRGHLLARSTCGELLVLDIGLGPHADLDDGAPALVDDAWCAGVVPPLVAEAHKGTRGRVLVVGGAVGMAGAPALAARGALRAGVGMVRLAVHPASLAAVQALVAEATAVPWPGSAGAPPLDLRWPHAVLVGPGLGGEARAVVEGVLADWRGPVVLDADALNVFAGDVPALAAALGGRAALLTPHPVECARVLGEPVDHVLAGRFDVVRALAGATGAAVLLKGVPTLVAAPDGRMRAVAAGTPALATAGSGDLLAGIAATLLAQGLAPLDAGACAAHVHGRAAERAGEGRPLRGLTLDDVVQHLGRAWALGTRPPDGALAHLPAVGERAT